MDLQNLLSPVLDPSGGSEQSTQEQARGSESEEFRGLGKKPQLCLRTQRLPLVLELFLF